MKLTMNTISDLRVALQSQLNLPLIFKSAEFVMSPGYHITEVKYGQISSVDCGRGVDQWSEVVIMLLNGTPNGSETYMTGKKFLQIVDAALSSLPHQDSEQLLFELSGSSGTIQRFSIGDIEISGNKTLVTLAGTSVVCKPALRFIAAAQASSMDTQGSTVIPTPDTSTCCGFTASSNACCRG